MCVCVCVRVCACVQCLARCLTQEGLTARDWALLKERYDVASLFESKGAMCGSS